jgi:hypothetical protein
LGLVYEKLGNKVKADEYHTQAQNIRSQRRI